MKFYFLFSNRRREAQEIIFLDSQSGAVAGYGNWWECAGFCAPNGVWEPLREGGLGGRWVTLPCVREKRCLAHATSQKGVSSTEMLILWLPTAIFRNDISIPQINSSIWIQFQELYCNSEYTGFYFSLFPFLSFWELAKLGGIYNLVDANSWIWEVCTFLKRSQCSILTFKRAWWNLTLCCIFCLIHVKNTFIDSSQSLPQTPNPFTFLWGRVNFESEFLLLQVACLLVVQTQELLLFSSKASHRAFMHAFWCVCIAFCVWWHSNILSITFWHTSIWQDTCHSCW